MNFVICFKNDLLGFTEFFNLGGNNLVTFLNPGHAWYFDSEKEARDFIEKYNASGLELGIITSEKAEKEYAKQLNLGFPYRRMPIKNLSLSRVYKNESADEVLEWWKAQNKTTENEVAYDHYKTWPNLYQKFKNLFQVCAYNNKDYTKKYYSVEMRVSQGDKFETFKEELERVVDYITYKDKDGGKIIPIFDRFLSAGGDSANFVINKDGTYSILVRWQNPYTGTLEQIFNYWMKERYYE